SFEDKLRRVDYFGAPLLTVAVILILLPLSWGGNKYEWSDSLIIGLLCGGFVVALIFILVEWKILKEPIVPLHLYRIRNLWATYASVFFCGMAFFGILFYLPVYFQVVKGESATVGGLETVPFVIGSVFSSIFSGVWANKRGTFAFFPPLGNFIFTVGAALCVLFKVDSHRIISIFILLLSGVGIGFTTQASTLAVQSAVKPEYMATVTTLVQFMRSLGQVFGIAIVGTVFNNKLESSLKETFLTTMSSWHPDKIEAIFECFVNALHYAFYFCAAICAMAFISSCFTEHKELKTNASQDKPEATVEMA
ncbi:hypothetical protein BGX26_011214, partial [Mortierella sp. AD094]